MSALLGAIGSFLEPTAGRASLSYAMVVVGLANAWAALHCLLRARTYRQDSAKTAKLNAAARS